MEPYTLYAGGYEGKIIQLEFDPSASASSGERLRKVDEVACGAAPTWLTFSPDGERGYPLLSKNVPGLADICLTDTARFVYSADEWGHESGALTTLGINEKGRLKVHETITTDGLWPCHSGLVTSTSPPQLLTANYKGANVHCVALRPDGYLDASSARTIPMDRTGSALGPVAWRQEQAHPHGAHPDPTGTVVAVPDLGTDDVRILHVDHATGTITEAEIVYLDPGDGPRHVVFGSLRRGANGRSEARLYVMNELHNSITVLRVNYPPEDSPSPFPTFEVLQRRVSLLPPTPFPHQSSFASWHSAELVLSPCGQFLLASNRAENHDPLAGTHQGPEDLLAVFRIDKDGLLLPESRQLVGCGGRAPRHMSFSSESRRRPSEVGGPAYLAVALHDSNEVVVFDFSAQGTLTEVARLRDVGRPGIVLWA